MTRHEGVLVVDKPAGPTSHDVVEWVRRVAGGVRVGHTGTLDPMATGVLPLCLGRATRLSRFLTASRKVYRGVIRLGITTDTYDAQGRTVAEADPSGIDEGAVREAAGRFVGDQMQTPPAFSARKHRGRPMHRLARAGLPVAPAPSPVTIYRFEVVEVRGPLVTFEAETSPGTYIRSLAHDLGIILMCGARLEELRRLAAGRFTLDRAHPLEVVLDRGRTDLLGEMMIPLREIDLGLPSVTVTSEGVTAMRTGRPLHARELTGAVPSGAAAGAEGPVRVQDEAGNLVGVAVPAGEPAGGAILRPDLVLVA